METKARNLAAFLCAGIVGTALMIFFIIFLMRRLIRKHTSEKGEVKTSDVQTFDLWQPQPAKFQQAAPNDDALNRFITLITELTELVEPYGEIDDVSKR
jgi:hypothetical protein